MKPKFLPLLERCIETGIRRGLSRAYKHDDNPSLQVIESNIQDSIEFELYEWFDFSDQENLNA